MLRGYMFSPITLLSLWAPLAIVLIIFFGLCSYWLGKIRAAPTRKIDVDADNFRQSINAALTVAGFIVPLLSGAIAYFALQPGFTRGELIPLVSATLLFVASVFAGLWNIFSLTAANGNKLELTEKHSGGFVAQFVIQLTLIFFGFLVAGIHLLFFFNLEGGRSPEQRTTQGSVANAMELPIVSVTARDPEVQTARSNPASRTIVEGTTLRFYHTDEARIVLNSREGTVERMSMEPKAVTT